MKDDVMISLKQESFAVIEGMERQGSKNTNRSLPR